MDTKHKKNLYFYMLCLSFSFIFVILTVKFYNFKGSFAVETNDVTINNPNKNTQILKVMVIEIDPLINSITNTTLYKNNNGHPKVSEYLGHDADISLNELIEDLEYTSHGYIDVQISKRVWLNEYPTYKNDITLSNGTKAKRLNEETYLNLTRISGTDRGDWWNLYNSGIFNRLEPYSFDYDYIINKFNLINRRNNKEFDQVWLVSIDPAQSYETIMVGSKPFWVNSPGYIANCENFLIGGASLSRRDAQFHALGHGVESILNAAFHKSYVTYKDYTGKGTYKYYKTSYSSYQANSININSVSEYNKLSVWEKFSLGVYSNSGNYASVGNIHFPFNGASDYDYTNTTKVYTNWRDWLNYPNISGNFILDNNNAWLTNFGNNTLGNQENKDPDRLYTRFWFYLMPHINGYTSDGHLNNWWKYFYSLDFVDEVKSNNGSSITLKTGEYVEASYTLKYNSGQVDNLTKIKEGNNVHIANENVLGFKNGYLYGKNAGNSSVSISYDGKTLVYNVTVESSGKTFTVNYDKNNALSIGATSLSCSTSGSSCEITMPSITPKTGYVVVGWANSKNLTSANYLPNKSYSIQNNMTLYAITKKNSLSIDENKKIIKNILPNTTYQDIKSMLSEDASFVSFTVTSIDGSAVDVKNKAKTGDKIKVVYSNKSITYTISVLGDMTGDGIIEINDVSKLYRGLKGRFSINDYEFYSGDLVNDNEIKINDVSKLYGYLKKRITSLEN